MLHISRLQSMKKDAKASPAQMNIICEYVKWPFLINFSQSCGQLEHKWPKPFVIPIRSPTLFGKRVKYWRPWIMVSRTGVIFESMPIGNKNRQFYHSAIFQSAKTNRQTYQKAILQIGNLTIWQIDHKATWPFGNLTKWQLNHTATKQNRKLTIRQFL